jgi:hypothetical protein
MEVGQGPNWGCSANGKKKARKREVQTKYYLSIYGSTALVDLGRIFSFLIYTQSVLDGGSARRKAAVYTQKNANTE